MVRGKKKLDCLPLPHSLAVNKLPVLLSVNTIEQSQFKLQTASGTYGQPFPQENVGLGQVIDAKHCGQLPKTIILDYKQHYK